MTSIDAYNERILIQVRARLLRAEIRLVGMKAENEQRAFSGFAPAYVEQQFMDMLHDEQVEYNQIIGTLQEMM